MGYKIRYGGSIPPTKSGPDKLGWGWGFGLFGMILVVGLLWPQMSQAVRQILFPWLSPETAEAFGSMLEQIRLGSTVGDAFGAFCRELLLHGV